jgi:hypothetical protein
MNDQNRKDSGYYAGMTVNERLLDASLIDSFEVAARARDRTKIISMLQTQNLRQTRFWKTLQNTAIEWRLVAAVRPIDATSTTGVR